MVETGLPGGGDDGPDLEMVQYPSMLSVASVNLSSSMSSLTLASPTEKGKFGGYKKFFSVVVGYKN